MDKTDFLEVETGGFEDDKIIYKFIHPYNGNDIDNYSHDVVRKKLLDIFKYYGVDRDKHISYTDFYLDGGENNRNIIFIRVNLREGKISKSHIRSKIGILKRTPTAIKRTIVCGKNIEYKFEPYNILDKVDEANPGIYLFTIQMEDNRPGCEFSHCIIKFDSVVSSNKASISFAKENGATHFLYYYTSENERQGIIEDIKNGDNYKMQLESYPEIGYLP